MIRTWMLGMALLLGINLFGQNTKRVYTHLNGKWKPKSQNEIGPFNEDVYLLFNNIQRGEHSGTFTGKSEGVEVSFAILKCIRASSKRFVFEIDYQVYRLLKDTEPHPAKSFKYMIVERETNKKGREIVSVAIGSSLDKNRPNFYRIRRME